ncbi:MAG: universal stress protein [Verrucomicrobiota bacterium]|nr:universal stress protein [Verrucomicrobiota bacterium]
MKTILVPIDFSDVTSRLIAAAEKLGLAFGSQLVLIHVSEPELDYVGLGPGAEGVGISVPRDFKAEQAKLDRWKGTLTSAGLETHALRVEGPAVEKILDEASRINADLIVVGSHGHGALYELLVGSVTSGILKRARCPVLVVPAIPGK